MLNITCLKTRTGAAKVAIVLPLLAISIVLAGCGARGGAGGINPDRNFAPPAATEPTPDLSAPADIAKALRSGGYVIYMRHGLTKRSELELESGNRKAGKFSLADCATQRNLSDEGIAESRAAGEQFRRMNLPVAKFLSSRYCRVIQTARPFSDSIAYSEALTSDGPIAQQPDRIEGVRALLTEKPPAGQNTMLFAHQGIFWEATRLTVQEGWAVVLEPGNFRRIVARIAPADWAKIAAAKP
jgi:phosphohistidine phosphatase SixA